MDKANEETAFQHTGAVEQDRPDQKTNVAPLEEQLDHRYQDPLNKSNDSGIPEKGQTPEFTGEKQMKDELNQDTNAEPTSVQKGIQHRSNAMSRMDTADGNDTDQNAQKSGTGGKQSGSRRDPDGNASGLCPHRTRPAERWRTGIELSDPALSTFRGSNAGEGPSA